MLQSQNHYRQHSPTKLILSIFKENLHLHFLVARPVLPVAVFCPDSSKSASVECTYYRKVRAAKILPLLQSHLLCISDQLPAPPSCSSLIHSFRDNVQGDLYSKTKKIFFRQDPKRDASRMRSVRALPLSISFVSVPTSTVAVTSVRT